MRCAEHDCSFVIAAHAHASPFQAVVARQLVEQRKEWGRFDIGRRQTHQTRERDFRIARLRNQGGQFADRATAFLRFVTNIYLHKAWYLPAGLVECFTQRLDEAGPVQRMDHIE